jgi:putative ATP-dependent endonuclease of OLD family
MGTPPVDPVAWRLEQQIRRVYEKLVGTSQVLPGELREGLQAAEAYLAIPRARGRSPAASAPRGVIDLAETPVRPGRRPGLFEPSIKQGTGLRSLALVALIGAVLDVRGRRALTEESQPIIVLEDAEAHLHPIAMSAMWELMSAVRAQKIVTTNSGELLAAVPLGSIRRIVTDRGGTRVHSIDTHRYTVDDLRRIAYHVRINRAGALFARCWLLVEGETEAWLLPELGQMCGYDFPAEGIRCVEFAQCGVRPLLKLANDLGIAWHLLADGDEAGESYAASAQAFLQGRPAEERITRLDEHDIEHCLFQHGYEHVFRELAGPAPRDARGRRARERTTGIIMRAIRARTKPGVALALLEAANGPGGGQVPPRLRTLLDTVARLARK